MVTRPEIARRAHLSLALPCIARDIKIPTLTLPLAQNLRAHSTCPAFGDLYVGNSYNTIIGYPENALSTSKGASPNDNRAHYGPANFTAINYTDFQAYSLKFKPLFKLPTDLPNVDPHWAGYFPAAYGAFDPPQTLERATAMVPSKPTTPVALPAAQVKPDTAMATPTPVPKSNDPASGMQPVMPQVPDSQQSDPQNPDPQNRVILPNRPGSDPSGSNGDPKDSDKSSGPSSNAGAGSGSPANGGVTNDNGASSNAGAGSGSPAIGGVTDGNGASSNTGAGSGLLANEGGQNGDPSTPSNGGAKNGDPGTQANGGVNSGAPNNPGTGSGFFKASGDSENGQSDSGASNNVVASSGSRANGDIKSDVAAPNNPGTG